MDRIVQRLNSPLLNKKPLASTAQTFGVPLKFLLRNKSILIPKVVTNICDYLMAHGLQSEGIFRINGSAKTIANLKSQFDLSGAGDLKLSEYWDIHALCGVLKLFLREVPHGIVPYTATRETIKVMEQLSGEKSRCISKLRTVLSTLPEENYNLLQYICKFLIHVAVNEASTKMSAANLGVVFGPCLFKCGLGSQVLRQQSVCNHATAYLITNFEQIFLENESDIPEMLDRNQDSANPSSTSLDNFLPKRHQPPTCQSIAALDAPRFTSLTPYGDALSPTTPNRVVKTTSGYSNSSLSLSPEHKSRQSNTEDLGSHGVLARELATIMTSISIPSMSSNEKLAISTQPNVNSPRKEHSSISCHMPPLAVVDLAKSLPSLICSPESQSICLEHRRYSPCNSQDSEKDKDEAGSGKKSSKSSVNSLLEDVKDDGGQLLHQPTLTPVLVESILETAPTSTFNKETAFDNDQLYLLSINQHSPPDVTKPGMVFPGSPSSIHFFSRAKYRSPSSLLTEMKGPNPVRLPNPPNTLENAQRHSTVNEYSFSRACENLELLEQTIDVFSTCEELNISSPMEATVTFHQGKEVKTPNAISEHLPPQTLIGGLVFHSTPNSNQVWTWPRKRNIFGKTRNRFSLETDAPLRDELPDAVVKVRVVESPSSNAAFPDSSMDLSGFLKILQAVLEARRQECHRPEDIDKMSITELAQEKIDLQKCLLYFENEKGRPCEVAAKRVMKPLYDRYRAVRRLVRLTTISATRDPPFGLPSAPHFQNCSDGVAIVTKDTGITQIDPKSITPTRFATPPLDDIRGNIPDKSHDVFADWGLSLPEFTQRVKELTQYELARGRSEILSSKHKLQRALHDFEKGIQAATNRPPSKQDRDQFREEYNRYRDFKQRLFVIDSLIQSADMSVDSLISTALLVGRAHRRRKDNSAMGMCKETTVPTV